jgi:hypothetical protein
MVAAMDEAGQSLATIDKQRCLASALAISMRVANSKFKGFTYFHCDANAGSGWNEQVSVDGSPIVFHKLADQYLPDMRRQAFFCDINEDYIKRLNRRLTENRWCDHSHLFAQDNEEVLPVFAQCIRNSGEKPHYAVGSIIVDPNGYFYRNQKGLGAPVASLQEFTSVFKRIDLVLNLNISSYWRMQGQAWPKPLMAPSEVLRSLNKQYWLVRRTNYGGWEWMLAVGRNVETGAHTRLGFHDIRSDEGRELMARFDGQRQSKMKTGDVTVSDIPRIPEAPGFFGGS